MKTFLTSLLFLLCSLTGLSAIEDFPLKALDERVASLQVMVHTAGEKRRIPYYSPRDGESLEISFDLLQATPEIVSFRLTHCDAFWQPSSLAESEYVAGMPIGNLPDGLLAHGTRVSYQSYRLLLDAEAATHPTLSGNYLLTLFPLGDEAHPLAVVGFALLEPAIDTRLALSAKTSRGSYDKYQAVSVQLEGEVLAPSVQSEELVTIVFQNGRRDNAIRLEKPSFWGLNRCDFDFDCAAVFEGGNIYRSVEILGDRSVNMGVERMELSDVATAYLFPHTPRSGTSYLSEHNTHGRTIVRQLSEAFSPDYYWVFFFLEASYTEQAIFVDGDAFAFLPPDERRLTWNSQNHSYEQTLLIKGGYFSFLYLASDGPEGALSSDLIEGNHYQTENQYTALAYLRAKGDRYYRLIGAAQLTASPF